MAGIPLARIYASFVEEAEPLRADLFARGYNVEVVFPDAELSGAADLELRLEHCSPEQAIARVEASSGSPSRCVFLTSTRNPQRELILIEMTVAASGADSRHPIYVPVNLPGARLAAIAGAEMQVATRANEKEERLEKIEKIESPLAAILPLPISETAAAPGLALAQDTVESDHSDLAKDARRDARKKDNADWGKAVGAEVTEFLAHAPKVEPAESIPAKILAHIRHSKNADRVRNHWEGLTLAGVALSLLLMIYAGWHAGTPRPWRPAENIAHASGTPAPAQPGIPAVQAISSRAQSSRPPEVRSISAIPARQSVARGPGEDELEERLIARDIVVRLARSARKPSSAGPILAAEKFPFMKDGVEGNKALRSNLVQTISVRTHPLQAAPAPIKKITDLK